MAYVSKEKMEQVRRDLKAEFPNIKFKVNKGTGHSTIYVTIVSAPYRFIDAETPYKDVSPWATAIENGYRIVTDGGVDIPQRKPFGRPDILLRILEIIHVGNHDRSDIYTDYFDVGFYVDISIGSYKNSFVFTGEVAKGRTDATWQQAFDMTHEEAV